MRAVGCSMIALAALIYHLPARLLAALRIAIIALLNLLDPIKASRFGLSLGCGTFPVNGVCLRSPESTPSAPIPSSPGIGTVAPGCCLGQIFSWNADRRRRFLLRVGLALTAAFLLVRGANISGDPFRYGPGNQFLQKINEVCPALARVPVLIPTRRQRIFCVAAGTIVRIEPSDPRPGGGRDFAVVILPCSPDRSAVP